LVVALDVSRIAIATTKQKRWLALAILALGIFLRVSMFPDNPPGLYVDEAYAGYEAYAILQTGADEWGVRLPVYFISSGSGQSVLYAYLSVPIIWGLGLSRFSIRLLSLFIGVLTLPLLYATVKRTLGARAALLALLLLAILPWHVMSSRWALDANLLPFFLLLGTYTMMRALEPNGSRVARWIALLPWGLALYAYAMSFFVLPVLLLLVFLFYRQTILPNWRQWLVGACGFGLLAFPIFLFGVKNVIAHRDLGIERFVPLGIPLLPFSRWTDVASPFPERLEKNLVFLINGFQDGEIRNMVIGNPPVFVVLFPLTLVGAFYLFGKYRREKTPDLFWLWIVASLPLFLAADPAIQRSNAIYIPMLVVAVYGLLELWRPLDSAPVARAILGIGVGTLIALQAGIFALDYFFVYPTLPDTEIAFFRGFDRAIRKGLEMAEPSETILVTSQVSQPQMLTATFVGYPPAEFQRTMQNYLDMKDQLNFFERIRVVSIGRFYFGEDSLPNSDERFVFVLGKWDDVPCNAPEFFLQTRLWQVGQCGTR
jgi:4-amino-4-deoxy-L-arabinose transferase-like glycosyltransferase